MCLLGIYEGFKTQYFRTDGTPKPEGDPPVSARSLNYHSPLDFLFYYSIANNVFSVFGFAGVLNAQKELVTGFFSYNAIQMVVAFHFFVDVCTDIKIRYAGEPAGLTGYERAAAAFIFFNFVLSICATVFALKAVEEIKAKQREEYNRLSVLSDTLQYEVDQ
ncbi:hypothetical protein WJX72_008436 [[Myrmecia] bisecta]|uniref:Uncharacterized protein n=1 Tax=[Myrmecia] bisecta TaxID=41462 RepID=A0AAW1QRT0_9CHLO